MRTEVEELQEKLKKVQEQLFQQEKMASLGFLSAGIAHEVQNPLNFVINFAKISTKLVDDLNDIVREISSNLNEDQRDDLEDITSSLTDNLTKIQVHSQRAVSVIQGILLQSRGKKNELLPTNIGDLVHEYVWLSYHALRASDKVFNASISEQYLPNMPKMMIIPQNLSRIILNITNNSCYAVAQRAQELGSGYKPQISVNVEMLEDNILIHIADNGGGIPVAVKEKLFKEIITTKPVGKGTGLGMTIAKQLAETMNGRLELETIDGEGTTVTIIIPAIVCKA